MILNQIADRIQHEADARWTDVIERLLFILERERSLAPAPPTTEGLLKKWRQSGLLKGLEGRWEEDLAYRLEGAAHELIDWVALDHPDPAEAENKAVETFCAIRQDVLNDQHDFIIRAKKSYRPVYDHR